ncbi:hypothetical protein JAAARDRAFT_28155 [Jaapia argillacea MUCL 33604]|uniref:Calcineurin-like phosphoesterase domain-containing protein n=1 Tax=Jaapia argillacea MUCL 33604 TaxID=933084 RepID=A0A067QBS7_9AGAM|nr:hypothetical protein JAAARDRAFT_28155 [Jaapia argillacea MUCL 33604]
MSTKSHFLLALLFLNLEVFAIPAQVPLQAPETQNARKLRGRFLHITDIHPDPHYKVDASHTSSCHRNKPKKEKTRAGYYGTPFSECDSPFSLTNFTLDYLDKQWSSEIDFVVWTGDNARHDNDRALPRTTKEIYDLNRVVARRMEDAFLSKGIPVIPSLGNNDVWPHNILMPGPNSITNEYSSIWKSFIPFPSYQVFQRGAYYSAEVIPNSVAVIALNTMYFYDSNKAVGGCEYKEPQDPGNLQFDWLEVQLEMYRDRDMQVYLTGHVPPSPGNFFPECYVRYVELSLRFQDTILGHLFGHMNADHFSLIEAEDLQLPSVESSQHHLDRPHQESKYDLFDTLIRDFGDLPKSERKVDFDNYAVINVSPSVVPNPYLPSFRVFTYNTTGTPKKSIKRKHGHRHGGMGDKKTECKKEIYADTWWCKLSKPWYSDPDSPSRTNTLWSPLGYAQYNIPEKRLDSSSENRKPKYKLEYLTFPLELLHPSSEAADAKGDFAYPIPLRHLPQSLRSPNSTKMKYTPYQLPDLTIPSWVELARLLADPKEKKLRKQFREYMYMGGEEG